MIRNLPFHHFVYLSNRVRFIHEHSFKPCHAFCFCLFFRHAWNSMHGWPSTHRFGSMMRAYIRDVTLWIIIYFIFWGDSPYPYRMTYCEDSIFSLSLDHPFVLVFQTKTSTTTRTVHLPVWLWLRHCWAAPWNGHWRSCSCRGKGAGNNSYPKPLVYTIQIHLNHSSIEQTHSLRQHTSCLSRIRRILSLNVIHFSCPAVPAPSVLHFLDTGVQKETQHTHTHTHPQTNTQFQFDSERRQMWPWQASWPSWERRGAAPRKGSFDGAMAHHGAMVTCTVCSDFICSDSTCCGGA